MEYKCKLRNWSIDVGSEVVEFTATDRRSLKTLVSAFASFYSGDDIECFVNGEKAVLYKDFGLATNQNLKEVGA